MSNEKKFQHDMYCANDPRSVAAMLRGNSDGREKRYARFAKKALQRDPLLTNDELMQMYAREVRELGLEGENKLEYMRKAKATAGRIVYHVFGVVIAFLALKHISG